MQITEFPIEEPIAIADGRYTQDEFQALVASIKKNGIQVPIRMRPDKRVTAGNHRVLAGREAGLATIPAIISDKPERAEITIALIDNLQRVDVPGYLKWQGCVGILDANPGMTLKDLAEEISLEASSLTRIMCVGKVSPETREALRLGKINLGQCYSIFKSPDEAEALREALAGAGREKLDLARRRLRLNGNAVRIEKAKLPLPGGKVVTVAGADLALEDVADALAQVSEGVKRCMKEGLDVKTCQSVFKDKAK